MDKVRFGRALGYGARHAARAVAEAVDAATSAPAGARPAAATKAGRPASPQPSSAPDRIVRAQKVVSHVGKAASGAVRSAGAPVVRFSRVLFLQVTGTFYILIALVVGQFLWRHHADLYLGWHHPDGQKAYLLAAVFAMFAYFAASNFVRAWRLERR